jgi:glycosyltransferase involved in cell wall biosynthesis
MKILALEPYYGGSHRAFLDGWIARSRHAWTTVTLPAIHWKWRMRHAPITMAQEVAALLEEGQSWDAIFCSDMLNLAEFLGLAPPVVRDLPTVVYFHENQLTYPVREPLEYDYHFAFSNMTAALAARRVWFNSAYHRDEFLPALRVFLGRMPDYQPVESIDRIRAKASIQPPGVAEFPLRGDREPGPLRILWAARWEHDKNPDDFFEALKILKSHKQLFRLSVLGESFDRRPPVFDWARDYFADEIDHWGFLPERRDYEAALLRADVITSTAAHEFFGISVVEAIRAGAYPLLPRRLAYPELLEELELHDADRHFYEGTVDSLSAGLDQLVVRLEAGDLWQGDASRGRRAVERFVWQQRAGAMDDALEELAEKEVRA